MEEKKFDAKTIIGYILIFGIIIWYFHQNQPTPAALEAQKKAQQEQVEVEKKQSKQTEAVVTTSSDYTNIQSLDSTQRVAAQNKLGAFSHALSLSGEAITTVETDVFQLKFNRKGGHLAEVKLRNFVDYDSVPIYLVKDKMNRRYSNKIDIFMGKDVTKAKKWGNKKLMIQYRVKKAKDKKKLY